MGSTLYASHPNTTYDLDSYRQTSPVTIHSFELLAETHVHCRLGCQRSDPYRIFAELDWN